MEIQFIEEREKAEFALSVQDEYLYYPCRPERLTELAKDFVIFEGLRFKKLPGINRTSR